MADEVVSDNRHQSGVVRDCDVTELYMADRSLKKIENLGKFRNLNRLWLNGNKLREVNCLHDNFRLTEIYLQDNLLGDITGSLRHLAALEVLMLQGNQLKQLTDAVHELKKMQRLRVLNLFGNPLAQDYDYRNYVIHNIPSLELLDRKEITKEERDKAQKRYGDVTELIKESLAFGRRVPTTASTESSMSPRETAVKSLQWENPRHGSSTGRQYAESSKESSVHKKTRLLVQQNAECESTIPEEKDVRRSLMQYSTFDWSAVPLSEERRHTEDSNIPKRIVTMHIR